MVSRTTQEDINFGERLKYARIRAKKSQGKLAEEVNLTFQQIQKYEKGLNRISASRLLEFAKILNISIDFFFRRDDIFSSNAALAEDTKKKFQHENESYLGQDCLTNQDLTLDAEKKKKIKNESQNQIKDFTGNDLMNDFLEKILLDLFRKISRSETKEKVINLIRSIIDIGES